MAFDSLNITSSVVRGKGNDRCDNARELRQIADCLLEAAHSVGNVVERFFAGNYGNAAHVNLNHGS